MEPPPIKRYIIVWLKGHYSTAMGYNTQHGLIDLYGFDESGWINTMQLNDTTWSSG